MGEPASTAPTAYVPSADESGELMSHAHGHASKETPRAPTHSEMTMLLRRVAASMRPGESAGKSLAQVLHVLRRCPWATGDLRAELSPHGDTTRLDLFLDDGGVRVRALVPVHIDVPHAEVALDVTSSSSLFAPLHVITYEDKLIVAMRLLPHEKPTVIVPRAV